MIHRLLTKAPSHLVALLGACTVTGCSTLDRSLVFTTHTTTGLEISAQGASSTPLGLVIGQKRFEGVMNPVYDEKGIDSTGNKYRREAYSVIAKFEGSIKANARAKATDNADASAAGSVATSQYFATGQAAVNLSNHLATAATLTDNPAVAQEIARMSGQSGILRPETHQATVLQLRVIRQFLVASAQQDPNGEAQAVLSDLDSLRSKIPTAYIDDILTYSTSKPDELHVANSGTLLLKGTAIASRSDFDSVISYYDALHSSVQALDAAIFRSTATGNPVTMHRTVIGTTDPGARTVDLATLRALQSQYVNHRDDFASLISSSSGLRSASEFLVENLFDKD
jgi:hypothetical protein